MWRILLETYDDFFIYFNMILLPSFKYTVMRVWIGVPMSVLLANPKLITKVYGFYNTSFKN